MPLNEAMQLVKRRRPEADPIPDFVAMLRDYELQCRLDGVIRNDDDNADAAVVAAAENSNSKRGTTPARLIRPDAPKRPKLIGPARRVIEPVLQKPESSIKSDNVDATERRV